MQSNQPKYNLLSKTTYVKKLSSKLLQKFYDLPIYKKQLISLSSFKLVFVIGFMGMGAYLIVTGGRAILLNQAKSELAIIQSNYQGRIQQITSSFRSQSDNLAIVAIAQNYVDKSQIKYQKIEQAQEILHREITALGIDYAAIIATNGTTILEIHTPKTEQLFTPQNLVSINQALNPRRPHQLTTSTIITNNNSQPWLIHYTATPLFHLQTQDCIGFIVSGNVINHDELILQTNFNVDVGGYSALYVYQGESKFSLVAYSSPSLQNSQQHLSTNLPENYFTVLSTALETPEQTITERFDLSNQAYTVVAQSLSNHAGEPVAVLVRGTQEAYLNQLITQGLYFQLAILTLSIVAEMGLAIWLAKTIAQSLDALQQTTQLFSRGILEARAPIFATDEVGQLSTNFNHMAEKICTYFLQVQFGAYEQKLLNQKLEKQIQERKQAQQQLRRSQERFSLAVEGVSDGIWDWDLQTCQIYFSPRWKQILGYEDWELPNVFKSWIDNIHSDDLDLVLNTLHRYLEGKISTYEVEFRARHKDGTYRWLLARGAALRDENNQPCRFAGSHTDITERKQAEKLLARRDRYLTALLEIQRQLLACSIDSSLYQIILSLLGSIANASRVYVCENYTDDQGKLRIKSIAQWCVEDIHTLGENNYIEQNYSSLQNIAYEDYCPRWKNILARGEFLNGVVSQFAESEQELWKDQGTLAILILPIIVKGEFFGFLGFDNCQEAKAWESSEISLLSSAASAISLAQERQFSQAQEKLQLTAIEAATDGVAIINSVGEHIYCNQAYSQIFGYDQSNQLIGKSWQSLYHQDEAQRLQTMIFSQLDTTGTWSGEAIANRQDSSTFAQEFSLTLLDDGGLICVCRDISDRKQAEAQLKANLKEKEVLLKEIHHRVKNNLYVISSLLNLQSSYVEDGYILDLFSDSQNRIQAMALIHEQLYQSQDLAQINFAEYIQSLVNNLFVSYSTNSSRIKPVLNLESICLNLDTAIPCGLLINELVTNSFKHAFPENNSGEIKIEAKSQVNDCLQLIISDNGIGMKPDFDWQNSHSLGLRLVNILSQQLDAKIECPNLSQGTKFYLTFSQLKYQERF